MKSFKITISPGEDIRRAIERAKEIAKEKNVTVEFDFNEITCLVQEKTIVDWMYRDYCNAHLMDWKTIGPQCEMEYDVDTEILLRVKQLDRARARKASQEKAEIKEKQDREALDKLIAGVELEIVPELKKEYEEYVSINSKDGYGKCVIDYSEAWAKLMQLEIKKGIAIKDCAEKLQEPLDYMGITGFMYGCIVKGLSYFWVYGEELRKWHNKEYNHEGDGVVNPAILTVKG